MASIEYSRNVEYISYNQSISKNRIVFGHCVGVWILNGPFIHFNHTLVIGFVYCYSAVKIRKSVGNYKATIVHFNDLSWYSSI